MAYANPRMRAQRAREARERRAAARAERSRRRAEQQAAAATASAGLSPFEQNRRESSLRRNRTRGDRSVGSGMETGRGKDVAGDIAAYKPSGILIDRQNAERSRRAAAATERRRRREIAESATGDGVADDIRQAAPMWQSGRGGIHERPAAGPPTGVGGVISPGLSSRQRNVPTGAGDFPVYKGAPAQNFRTAFAAARKGGKKTFTWQGRKYTTDVA